MHLGDSPQASCLAINNNRYIFKVLRAENCQPRILYPVKRESEIETCPERQKPRVCLQQICTTKKVLEVLQEEGVTSNGHKDLTDNEKHWAW